MSRPWKPAKAYAVDITRHDDDHATITVLCPYCTRPHKHNHTPDNGATAIRQPPCGLDVAYRIIIPTLNVRPAT